MVRSASQPSTPATRPYGNPYVDRDLASGERGSLAACPTPDRAPFSPSHGRQQHRPMIAMTYWVMPWLVRLADRWLRPSQLTLSGIPKDRSKLSGGSDV